MSLPNIFNTLYYLYPIFSPKRVPTPTCLGLPCHTRVQPSGTNVGVGPAARYGIICEFFSTLTTRVNSWAEAPTAMLGEFHMRVYVLRMRLIFVLRRRIHLHTTPTDSRRARDIKLFFTMTVTVRKTRDDLKLIYDLKNWDESRRLHLDT